VRDWTMSPGGVAHRRALHKGEREILYVLQTSAEGPCSMESSNLREREGGGGRELINSDLNCGFQLEHDQIIYCTDIKSIIILYSC
jgi:hypothetical protein